MRPSRQHFWLLIFLLIGAAHAGEMRAPVSTLRLAFTLTNPKADAINDAVFHVYAPIAGSAHHDVVSVVSSLPYVETVDSLGNRVLAFPRLTFSPYATRRLVLTFGLSIAERQTSMETHRYLAPEPFIESDSPEVMSLAKRISADGPTEDFPRRTHEWLRSNMRYVGYVAEDLGARHAARTLSGDCTEYAALFVALMRAKGIPARMMGGWVFSGSAVARAADFHNWAEFLADGRWHLADPQKGNFDELGAEYVATRIIAHSPGEKSFAHRFRVSHEDLIVTMD